jgi:hypothetical protein
VISPYDAGLESEALSVIQLAQRVDQNLQQWYQTLPHTWRHQTVGIVSDIIEDAATATMWTGEQHVYHDTPIASILNDYRVCRIFCQHVIMYCTTWLSPNPDASLTSAYKQAVFVVQKMVDEISACVPFHLSYDMQPVAKELGQDKTGAHSYYLIPNT